MNVVVAVLITSLAMSLFLSGLASGEAWLAAFGFTTLAVALICDLGLLFGGSRIAGSDQDHRGVLHWPGRRKDEPPPLERAS
jgi:hypothetical protein